MIGPAMLQRAITGSRGTAIALLTQDREPPAAAVSCFGIGSRHIARGVVNLDHLANLGVR